MRIETRFRCVLHGSFRRHFELIQEIRALFFTAGIDVLAPRPAARAGSIDGFELLEGEEGQDPRLVELLYLHHLKQLGLSGFSYFVNPDGYLGRSASYELGIAQATDTRCFFLQPLRDHPAYIQSNSIWSPEELTSFIQKRQRLPKPMTKLNERTLHRLWEKLILPGAITAVGAIIEFAPKRANVEKEVLLVRTHKWGNRFSVVGERVRRNERIDEALTRGIREETGLQAEVGDHLCTFDQISGSGYYLPVQQIFIDKEVRVHSRRVRLDDEAEEHVWIPARYALTDLPLEPNARHTLELYVTRHGLR